MELNILIAEPQEVLRAGLRAIFMEDRRVANVHEAANEKDLQRHMLHSRLDLVVVDQSLVKDISALRIKNLVILAVEPNLQLLKAAYKHGARGYLSVNVSAELLRTILDPTEDSFLIEPRLVPWIMQHVFDNTYISFRGELLTPREKEITGLLREGLDRPSIAKLLCITETTLKTHIRNITKKRDKAE